MTEKAVGTGTGAYYPWWLAGEPEPPKGPVFPRGRAGTRAKRTETAEGFDRDGMKAWLIETKGKQPYWSADTARRAERLLSLVGESDLMSGKAERDHPALADHAAETKRKLVEAGRLAREWLESQPSDGPVN